MNGVKTENPGLILPEVSPDGTVTRPVKNKRASIQEIVQSDQKVHSYRCEECQTEYPDERLVRVHINRSTDEDHANKSGFMPETHVEVLSEAGEVLGCVPGSGNAHLDGVKQFTEEDCPDSFTTAEKVIITTAVRNPNVHAYSDVHKLVEERYRELGDAIDINPTGYQKTYRTIKDYLDVEEDTQNTTTQMTPETTQNDESTEEVDLSTFRDLTEKKQVILLEYAINPDQTKKQIAETANVSVAYPGQVLDEYSDLKNALLELDELPPLTLDVEGEEYSVSESIQQHQTSKDAESSGEAEGYEDLTDTQQDIVDALASNPPGKYTNKEIAEIADCFYSYVPRVKKEHADIIESRRKEVFGVSEDTETTPEVRNKPAESYKDLTEKQKAVVDVLREEDDPTDPERTYEELAKAAGQRLDVPEEEYPHITHVRNTVKKYGELALEIVESDEPLTDGPVTWRNRRALSASPYDDPEPSETKESPEPTTQQQTIEPDAEASASEITRDMVSEMSQTEISEADEDFFNRCNYRALQEIAKPYDINARQSEDSLREAIVERLVETESDAEEDTAIEEIEEPQPEPEEIEEPQPEPEEIEEPQQTAVQEPQKPDYVEQSTKPELSSGELLVDEDEIDDRLVAIPKSVLTSLITQAEITRENAEREIELLGKNSVATGRLVVASEWERSLKSLLEQRTVKNSDVEVINTDAISTEEGEIVDGIVKNTA